MDRSVASVTPSVTSPEVSLVIPVYNEEGSLEALHAEIQLSMGDTPFEIVFVDDGSTDGSRKIMQRLAAEQSYIRIVKFHRNFGKSYALAAGFRESSGRIVVTMDADLQDDPTELPRMLAAIDGGLDLVSGWKRVRHDPWSKTAPSRLFNWVTAKSTGIQLHDFNCGFKAYRRELVDDLSIYGELHRFIPALAYWKGYRVDEIDVNHRPRQFGKSKFGARRFLSGLMDLVTVLFLTRFHRKPMHLFGTAGMISFVLGLVINLYLTLLKLQGESIGTRPLLMLGVLLMVIGIQFFALGLLADLTNLSFARGSGRDHVYTVWPPHSTEPIRASSTREETPTS